MKVVLQAVLLVESYSGNSLKWLPGGLKIQNVLGEYTLSEPLLAPTLKNIFRRP